MGALRRNGAAPGGLPPALKRQVTSASPWGSFEGVVFSVGLQDCGQAGRRHPLRSGLFTAAPGRALLRMSAPTSRGAGRLSAPYFLLSTPRAKAPWS
ncbi:MAG: hypothetical protein QXP31_08895 [Pyrobaculum sp.]